MRPLLALSLLLLPALPIHAQTEIPRQIVRRSIVSENTPERTLQEMLPPGKYLLICSPTHPDLEKGVDAPYALPAEVTYEGDRASITVKDQTVPVYSQRNFITFTLPPTMHNGAFWTSVFSGSSPTDTQTPYFRGLLQLIYGWKGTAEEYIFSLKKLTEEK